MLISFFERLRAAGVPVSLREYLTLLEALRAHLAFADWEAFYLLARTCLVKDERHFDRFDRAFALQFEALAEIEDALAVLIPEEWLRQSFLRSLSEEERAKIQGLGDLERLLAEFRKRLAEQRGRHQGGNKWIGTGGTSPFGHGGYHPEGIRVGGEGRERRAVKLWERRDFRNLDADQRLSRRNLKLALRRLRRFAREGAATELDLPATIRATAHNGGLLDLKVVPERRNAVKVLLFFDVGGSMEPFVRVCEELFAAARSEFKHMEHFYFHNMLYEYVWKDNRLRHQERTSTAELLHRYGPDYRVILVGDASMAPYEITAVGGCIEYHNAEPGAVWLKRLVATWRHLVWLNPVPEEEWDRTRSIGMVRQLVEGAMFPLTLAGLEGAMERLVH